MGQKWNNCFRNVRQLMEKNKLDAMSYSMYSTYYNAVRFHNKNESFNHFLVKCAVAKILYNKRMSVSGEFPLMRRGIEVRTFDVIDFTEMNVYEVESEKNTPRKLPYLNEITIYIDDMPGEVKSALAVLRRWLEAKVV